MSEAAVTFKIFGKSCVVILPPTLEVAPANDVHSAASGAAQAAQVARGGASRPSETPLRRI